MPAKLDPPHRPGLAKVRRAPLLVRRRVSLVASVQGRWREVFEHADVVSEGRVEREGAAFVYYGTTSLLLASRSSGGSLPDADLPVLARVLELDPHARLSALRVACREASSRSPSPLGTLRVELSFAAARAGIVASLDVVADVLSEGTFAAGS